MKNIEEKNNKNSWVRDVASLARIKLSNAEEEKFAGQLTGVLANFELLNQIDTKDTQMTSQVTGLTDVFRADEILNKNDKENRDKLLSNVPEVENGSIKVPEVFESK